MQEAKNFSGTLVIVLLLAMFMIMYASQIDDAAIMDELAHIPAAYSYVSLKDMRLNPEHPPLIKDLAGLPLLLFKPNFPTDTKAWKDEINGQWDQGAKFLYESGNDPDRILRYSRLPVMLLAVLFGWLLYKWSLSLYGNKVAILTTFFYALSPTFLAHSRYVTTDLAAAFGFFIGIAAYLRFLEKPSPKRMLIAGVAFGIAQLLKFSLFLLVPIYGVLLLLWVLLEERERAFELKTKEKIAFFIRELIILSVKTVIIGLIGIGLIWIVYTWHIWNYPIEKQIYDSETILRSFGFRPIVNLDLWLIRHEIFRPLGQYLLGLLMVVQRAAGGNTTFFLGEISSTGWTSYFPIAYLLKESLAFHIISLIALWVGLKNTKKAYSNYKKGERIHAALGWMRDNFAITASIFFIFFYWLYSMKSPLNIGIRHVMPTFPFIYLIVSREIAKWLYQPKIESPKGFTDVLYMMYKNFIEPIPRILFTSLLMLWIALSTIIAFPFFLSYYNELIGTENGYKYITDSNYDWGQDLKRLAKTINDEKIDKIYLEYFGGGSPRYYLGDKFVEWNSRKGPPPQGSYFALSATLLQGAKGAPVKGFVKIPEESYEWLNEKEPILRAGTSIFIFKMR